ncbi:hypothetical protein ES707_00321 [subsurface metagenome]
MPLKKKEVMWEELEKFKAGAFSPSPHTHPRTEISDFWDAAFWGNIPDKPSTFPPSAHTHDDRYYTKTELNDGQLDTRYYTKSQVDTKLALQDTLAEMGDVKIISPEHGEFLMWDAEANGGKWVCSTGITDHGALSGLEDDDHTQYHTDARGDNRYFRKVEFLATTAGPTDSGKPIKLNDAGLVDNTMMVAADVDKVDGYHASAFSLIGHIHDSRYYTESEVDTKLALQDTLAEMGDVHIVSPQDGEFLIWDAEAEGGKWIASSEIGAHNHDDRYYTETELDSGQLDDRYFRENEFLVTTAGVADAGKPIKLNAAGMVDNTMTAFCDADKVDGEHALAIVTKARVDAKACDHGALSGRGDDDHSIYYNAARHTKAVHDALLITVLGSGALAKDHGTAATDMLVNVCYGTGNPPTANTTTIGTLFVKYTA